MGISDTILKITIPPTIKPGPNRVLLYYIGDLNRGKVQDFHFSDCGYCCIEETLTGTSAAPLGVRVNSNIYQYGDS
jgi:hypothetical protein